MSEVKPAVKKWKEMKTDVLIESFKELNIIELFHVSQVCQLWRLACSDPLLWGTLDFGLLESNFIPTMAPPYVFVDKKSDEKLIKLLKIAMPISCGNVTNLVFHFNLYMEDDHLTYISERCPHLKRLVMPAWNRITKTGIWQAIKRWKELESLTIFSISHLPDIMGEISRNCENFSTLKVTGTFDGKLASEIAHNLPRLKIISLRWSILTREALLVLLDRMEHLEILNITHCFLVENLTPGKKVLWELGSDILNKAKRLKEFYYCRNISCETCQRMIKDKGLKRWYRYEESFWRKDEVKLLALGEDYGKLFNKACLETLDNDKWFKN